MNHRFSIKPDITAERLKAAHAGILQLQEQATFELEAARRRLGLLLLAQYNGEEMEKPIIATREAMGRAQQAYEDSVLLAAAAAERHEELEAAPPVVDQTAARREARRVFDAAKTAMRAMSFKAMTRVQVRAEGKRLLDHGRRCGRVPEAKELLEELSNRVNGELLAELA